MPSRMTAIGVLMLLAAALTLNAARKQAASASGSQIQKA